MGLYRKVIKALIDLNFYTPTKIQELTIPSILSGKDVLGKSVTGSGKTAAFLLPIIQNIGKDKLSNYIKCLVILPTWELAMQCYEMF